MVFHCGVGTLYAGEGFLVGTGLCAACGHRQSCAIEPRTDPPPAPGITTTPSHIVDMENHGLSKTGLPILQVDRSLASDMKPLARLSAFAAAVFGGGFAPTASIALRPRPLPRVTESEPLAATMLRRGSFACEGNPVLSRRAQRFGRGPVVYKKGPHRRSYVAALANRRTRSEGGSFARLSNGMLVMA